MRYTYSPQLKTKSGQTFLDVIIVVAAGCILSAVFFPVLAQTKAQAKQSVAFNNAKHLALAQLMYCSDNNDRFVPYFDTVPGDCNAYTVKGHGKYWPELLTLYVQRSRIAEGQPLADPSRNAFIDPTKGSNIPDSATVRTGRLTSWGMSDHIVNWWTPSSDCRTYRSVSQSQIGRPSQSIMLVETWDWQTITHRSPGAPLALSFYDCTGGFPGTLSSIDAPYHASYVKCDQWTWADPSGLNIVIYNDGRIQMTPVGKITRSGNLWSLTEEGVWP